MAEVPFPADQDLAPGDISISSVILPKHSRVDAAKIITNLREAQRIQTTARTGEDPGLPDVIVMAVPAGKGKAFIEGLQLALQMRGQFLGNTDLEGPDA